MPTHPAIHRLEDSVQAIKALVYGNSGVGKTPFGASAPNTLLMSAEPGGTVSAKIAGSTADLWQIRSWDEFVEALVWLEDNPNHGYNWIVIDTVTALHRMLLYWLLEKAVEANPDRNPDIPAIQDHFEWQNKFLRMVDRINDLPVNTLLLAHVMAVDTDEGIEQLWPALLGGRAWPAISRSMCAKVSVVGYMRRIEEDDPNDKTKKVYKSRIRWKESATTFGKDRFDALGTATTNIDLPEIEARILSALASVSPTPTTSPKPAPRRRRRIDKD